MYKLIWTDSAGTVVLRRNDAHFKLSASDALKLLIDMEPGEIAPYDAAMIGKAFYLQKRKTVKKQTSQGRLIESRLETV